MEYAYGISYAYGVQLMPEKWSWEEVECNAAYISQLLLKWIVEQ